MCLEVPVKKLEDLPEVVLGSGGYCLPNWRKIVGYRATSWAYLQREDGGPFVTYAGKTYVRVVP
jgi:hypothetical protein